MKWWFKVKRNLLYRRFNFDPHNFILKSFKLDKSFKHIVIRKKIIIVKRLKKFKKIKFKKLKRFIFKKYNIKKGKIKRVNSLVTNTKKKWYYNFWKKIKLNYLVKKRKIRIKKRKKKRWKLNLIAKIRRRLIRRRFYEMTIEKRKQIDTRSKAQYKLKRRKTLTQRVWLQVKEYQKSKKNWWLLRICIRKIAIYYGFKSLKRYRFINKFADSAMAIKSYNSDRLESMLNMFMLKINIFDNIFISNNFIRVTGFVNINFRPIYEPNRYVKVGQLVSFSNVRKMQSIFRKRCMFSKHLYLKNYKKGGLFLKSLIKIIHNAPRYVHYDYQLMMFSIFRLPNRREHFYSYNKLKDNWAIDTRLQYN